MILLISLHVNCCRDGAPAPDALPERREECEHGHEPEVGEERSPKEGGEVREEPRPGRDGCAIILYTSLVVKETGNHEHRDDKRRKDAS